MRRDRAATHHTAWTVGVVSLGIAVRMGAAITVGGSFHFVDEAIYFDAAHHLLAGKGFGASYANVLGYPVILAALAAPWPGSLLLVRCAQAAIAGAGCVLVLALGKRMFGLTAALVAAALYALDPLLVVTAALLYPETMAAMLLMAMLLAVWVAAGDDRVGASAIAGVALGVLVQCRPVALVLLPLVTVWLAWSVAVSLSRRTLHCVALATCCLVAFSPWVVRNLRLHGHVVPVETAGLSDAPVARSEIASAGLVSALVGRARQDPLGFARHVTSEFGHFWEPYPTRLATDDPEQRDELHRADPRLPSAPSFQATSRDWVSTLSFGAESLLAIIGIGVAWRRQRAGTVLLLAVALTYALGFALIVAKLPYRITVLACVLLFAAVGATALAGAASAAWRREGRSL